MSDRPKITLSAKPREADETHERRRKPVRPNAPIARDRVRREPPAESAPTPQAESPRGRPPARREDRQPGGGAPARRTDERRTDERRQADRRPPPQADRQPRREPGREFGGDRRPPDLPAVPPPARQAPDDGRVRLSKVMSERGLASRREADDWITQGWVLVDGEVVTELGTRIWPHQVVSIDPEARAQQAQRVTILLHKPIGYVSGQAEDGHEPAVTLVRPENRWAGDNLPWKLTRGHLHKLAPAGRLDIDSTGLLVLTQDGRIARQLIGEDALVEKEYLVRVQSVAQPDAENVAAIVPEDVLERLRHGLSLDDKALKPAKVSWQNEQQLRFVLREGRKRQIRRMCELVGLKVTGLKRVRMGQVVLGKLPLGQWRFLRPDERF